MDARVAEGQVDHAFLRAGEDWGASWEIAWSLEDLLDMAEEYANLGDRRNAMLVYRTLASEVLDRYGEVDDEEGDLGEIVNKCAHGSGASPPFVRNDIRRPEAPGKPNSREAFCPQTYTMKLFSEQVP